MPSIIENIWQRFPQFPRQFNEMAMEYAMEKYDEDFEFAKRCIMGVTTLADAREVAEYVMEGWACHALEAIEGLITAQTARELSNDYLVNFFKIKALYDGFDEAGLI